MTASGCVPSAEEKWKVSGGIDLAGEELTVIVVLQEGVVVVTLF